MLQTQTPLKPNSHRQRWPNPAQKAETFRRIGYAPFPDQQPVHTSRADVVQIVGAEGAGKSAVTAAELTACVPWSKLIYLIGETYDNPRREFEYMRNNLLMLGAVDPRQVSMPKVDKWQMTTRTGCRIRTLSVREGATAIIATGEEPDIFCLTEAGIIQSYSVFTACARRATRSRGRVVLAGTLKDNYGWYAGLTDDLAAQGNIWRGETFSIPAWANTLLYPGGRNDPEILRLEEALPEDEFARTIAAKRMPSKALVFPEFSYAAHVRPCPFDPSQPVYLWVDPGYYPSAYVVLAIQFHGQQVWVIDEIYLYFHTHEQVIEVAQGREWWPQVDRLGVIDFAGRQHHAEKSAEEVWRAVAGKRLRSQFVGVLDGIARHRTFLGHKDRDGKMVGVRLIHDPRCKFSLEEYKKYRRPADRDGNATSDIPIDADNHSMKALAYGLVDRFGFVDGSAARKLQSAQVDFYARQGSRGAGPNFGPNREQGSKPARSDEEIERMLAEAEFTQEAEYSGD